MTGKKGIGKRNRCIIFRYIIINRIRYLEKLKYKEVIDF